MSRALLGRASRERRERGLVLTLAPGLALCLGITYVSLILTQSWEMAVPSPLYR